MIKKEKMENKCTYFGLSPVLLLFFIFSGLLLIFGSVILLLSRYEGVISVLTVFYIAYFCLFLASSDVTQWVFSNP